MSKKVILVIDEVTSQTGQVMNVDDTLNTLSTHNHDSAYPLKPSAVTTDGSTALGWDGSAFTVVPTASALSSLADVSAGSAASGDILVSDGAGNWTAQAMPEGGIPQMTRDDSGPTTDYIFG